MVGTISVFAVAVLLLTAKYLFQFTRNLIRAAGTGLPYIAVPVDQNNILWMVSSVALRPWMERYLPASLWSRVKLAIYGWEYREKLAPFHEITNGEPLNEKSFWVCGTGRSEFWTSSPNIATQIVSQPKNFQQLDLTKLFVGSFGENLITSEGATWTKHRSIVATAVNERISPVVWAESVRQTSGLLDEVCANSNGDHGETIRFYDMIKTVTINVLSKAGLGSGKDWTPAGGDRSEDVADERLSYMEAVKLLNNNLAGPIVIPERLLLRWPKFMPDYRNLRRLGLAKSLFPVRTKEMIEQERAIMNDADVGTSKPNFMRLLLKAANDTAGGKSGKNSSALTDSELISNLYLFTAAGYDTTANTLAYSITLLVRYPKWQAWLFEEIDGFVRAFPNLSREELMANYQTIFPKCTRILAFMFETLRLFSPLIHIAKMVVHKPQTIITDSGRAVLIPANTNVYVDIVALHLDASVWRDLNLTPEDSDADWEDDMPGRHGATLADMSSPEGRLADEWRFRPGRFINSNGTLFQPPRGSYLPWSAGPRVCPGQRFAQIEFVAIFFTILSRYRIEAVSRKGESRAELNKRLDWEMQNSISKLTLEMVNVYDKSYDDENFEHAAGLRIRLSKRVA